LGAEITGFDLSRDLDGATVAVLRAAWLDHLVLFSRNQTLSPERFLSFARHFGELVEYPFIKDIERFPEVTPVAIAASCTA
jgi:taurine dioxygenase